MVQPNSVPGTAQPTAAPTNQNTITSNTGKSYSVPELLLGMNKKGTSNIASLNPNGTMDNGGVQMEHI